MNNLKKRLTAWALTLAMVLPMLPAGLITPALAATGNLGGSGLASSMSLEIDGDGNFTVTLSGITNTGTHDFALGIIPNFHGTQGKAALARHGSAITANTTDSENIATTMTNFAIGTTPYLAISGQIPLTSTTVITGRLAADGTAADVKVNGSTTGLTATFGAGRAGTLSTLRGLSGSYYEGTETTPFTASTSSSFPYIAYFWNKTTTTTQWATGNFEIPAAELETDTTAITIATTASDSTTQIPVLVTNIVDKSKAESISVSIIDASSGLSTTVGASPYILLDGLTSGGLPDISYGDGGQTFTVKWGQLAAGEVYSAKIQITYDDGTGTGTSGTPIVIPITASVPPSGTHAILTVKDPDNNTLSTTSPYTNYYEFTITDTEKEFTIYNDASPATGMSDNKKVNIQRKKARDIELSSSDSAKFEITTALSQINLAENREDGPATFKVTAKSADVSDGDVGYINITYATGYKDVGQADGSNTTAEVYNKETATRLTLTIKLTYKAPSATPLTTPTLDYKNDPTGESGHTTDGALDVTFPASHNLHDGDVITLYKDGVATATTKTVAAGDEGSAITWNITGLSKGVYTAVVTAVADTATYSDSAASSSLELGYYTVSYNGNGSDGGTNPGPVYIKLAGASTGDTKSYTLASNTFTKSGSTFSKWAQGSTSGTQRNAGANVNITGDITFYAIWSASTYTLTVASGGNGTVAISSPSSGTSSGSSVTGMTSGSTATITATPSDGYRFGSWAITSGSGSAVPGSASGSVTVTADVTYTATFTPNVATVTMYTNGTKDTSEPTTRVGTNKVQLYQGSTKQYDMTWAIDHFGASGVAEGNYSIYVNGMDTGTTLNMPASTDQNKDLKYYTVKYGTPTNGSGTIDGSTADVEVLVGGTKNSVTLAVTPAAGYTLNAWTQSVNAGTFSGSPTGTWTINDYSGTASGGITLTPTFKYASYTVTFHRNDGTADTGTQNITGTQNLKTISAIGWTRTGYDFGGWAASAEDATAGTVLYTNGESVTLTGDKGLYAIWTATSVALTNGTASVTVDDDNYSFSVTPTASGGTGTYTYEVWDGDSWESSYTDATTNVTLTGGTSITSTTGFSLTGKVNLCLPTPDSVTFKVRVKALSPDTGAVSATDNTNAQTVTVTLGKNKLTKPSGTPTDATYAGASDGTITVSTDYTSKPLSTLELYDSSKSLISSGSYTLTGQVFSGLTKGDYYVKAKSSNAANYDDSDFSEKITVGEDTKYNVAVTYTAGGTASFGPSTTPVANNTPVTFTATPSAGYHFVNWTDNDNGNIVLGSTNPWIVNVNKNYNIRANFAANDVTVMVKHNNVQVDGVTYAEKYVQLYDGSTLVGSPIITSGGTATFNNLTANTQYTVYAGTTTSNLQATDIKVTYTVNATSGAGTVSWTNGSTVRFYDVSLANGNYADKTAYTNSTPPSMNLSTGTAMGAGTNPYTLLANGNDYVINLTSHVQPNYAVTWATDPASTGAFTGSADPYTWTYAFPVSYTDGAITITPTYSRAAYAVEVQVNVNGSQVADGKTVYLDYGAGNQKSATTSSGIATFNGVTAGTHAVTVSGFQGTATTGALSGDTDLTGTDKVVLNFYEVTVNKGAGADTAAIRPHGGSSDWATADGTATILGGATKATPSGHTFDLVSGPKNGYGGTAIWTKGGAAYSGATTNLTAEYTTYSVSYNTSTVTFHVTKDNSDWTGLNVKLQTDAGADIPSALGTTDSSGNVTFDMGALDSAATSVKLVITGADKAVVGEMPATVIPGGTVSVNAEYFTLTTVNGAGAATAVITSASGATTAYVLKDQTVTVTATRVGVGYSGTATWTLDGGSISTMSPTTGAGDSITITVKSATEATAAYTAGALSFDAITDTAVYDTAKSGTKTNSPSETGESYNYYVNDGTNWVTNTDVEKSGLKLKATGGNVAPGSDSFTISGTPTVTGDVTFNVKAKGVTSGREITTTYTVTVAPKPIGALVKFTNAPVVGDSPDKVTTDFGTAIASSGKQIDATAGEYAVEEVSWSPNHGTFQNGTVYTVSVKLRTSENYTFDASKTFKINDLDDSSAQVTKTISTDGTTVANGAKNLVTLTYKFPPTKPTLSVAEITGLADSDTATTSATASLSALSLGEGVTGGTVYFAIHEAGSGTAPADAATLVNGVVHAVDGTGSPTAQNTEGDWKFARVTVNSTTPGDFKNVFTGLKPYTQYKVYAVATVNYASTIFSDYSDLASNSGTGYTFHIVNVNTEDINKGTVKNPSNATGDYYIDVEHGTTTPLSAAAAHDYFTFDKWTFVGTDGTVADPNVATGTTYSPTGDYATPVVTATFKPVALNVNDSTLDAMTYGTDLGAGVNITAAGTGYSAGYGSGSSTPSLTFAPTDGGTALTALGLSLAADGTITGRPQQVGTFTIPVMATDSQSGATKEFNVTFTVGQATPIVTFTGQSTVYSSNNAAPSDVTYTATAPYWNGTNWVENQPVDGTLTLKTSPTAYGAAGAQNVDFVFTPDTATGGAHTYQNGNDATAVSPSTLYAVVDPATASITVTGMTKMLRFLDTTDVHKTDVDLGSLLTYGYADSSPVTYTFKVENYGNQDLTGIYPTLTHVSSTAPDGTTDITTATALVLANFTLATWDVSTNKFNLAKDAKSDSIILTLSRTGLPAGTHVFKLSAVAADDTSSATTDDDLTITFVVDPAELTGANAVVKAPVTGTASTTAAGMSPVGTATLADDQYDATNATTPYTVTDVTWATTGGTPLTAGDAFAPGTAYTVTVTLTPDSNHSFPAVAADNYTINGQQNDTGHTITKNSDGTVTMTYTYPPTAPTMNDLTLTGADWNKLHVAPTASGGKTANYDTDVTATTYYIAVKTSESFTLDETLLKSGGYPGMVTDVSNDGEDISADYSGAALEPYTEYKVYAMTKVTKGTDAWPTAAATTNNAFTYHKLVVQGNAAALTSPAGTLPYTVGIQHGSTATVSFTATVFNFDGWKVSSTGGTSDTSWTSDTTTSTYTADNAILGSFTSLNLKKATPDVTSSVSGTYTPNATMSAKIITIQMISKGTTTEKTVVAFEWVSGKPTDVTYYAVTDTDNKNTGANVKGTTESVYGHKDSEDAPFRTDGIDTIQYKITWSDGTSETGTLGGAPSTGTVDLVFGDYAGIAAVNTLPADGYSFTNMGANNDQAKYDGKRLFLRYRYTDSSANNLTYFSVPLPDPLTVQELKATDITLSSKWSTDLVVTAGNYFAPGSRTATVTFNGGSTTLQHVENGWNYSDTITNGYNTYYYMVDMNNDGEIDGLDTQIKAGDTLAPFINHDLYACYTDINGHTVKKLCGTLVSAGGGTTATIRIINQTHANKDTEWGDTLAAVVEGATGTFKYDWQYLNGSTWTTLGVAENSATYTLPADQLGHFIRVQLKSVDGTAPATEVVSDTVTSLDVSNVAHIDDPTGKHIYVEMRSVTFSVKNNKDKFYDGNSERLAQFVPTDFTLYNVDGSHTVTLALKDDYNTLNTSKATRLTYSDAAVGSTLTMPKPTFTATDTNVHYDVYDQYTLDGTNVGLYRISRDQPALTPVGTILSHDVAPIIVSGVTAPVKGNLPDTVVNVPAGVTGYTLGTPVWSYKDGANWIPVDATHGVDASGNFLPDTVYKLTVPATAQTSYTFPASVAGIYEDADAPTVTWTATTTVNKGVTPNTATLEYIFPATDGLVTPKGFQTLNTLTTTEYYARTANHTAVNTVNNDTNPGGKNAVTFAFSPAGVAGSQVFYSDGTTVKTLADGTGSAANTLYYGRGEWKLVYGDTPVSALNKTIPAEFTDTHIGGATKDINDASNVYDGKNVYVQIGSTVLPGSVGTLTVKQLEVDTLGRQGTVKLNYSEGEQFTVSSDVKALTRFNSDSFAVEYDDAAYADSAAADGAKYYFEYYNGASYQPLTAQIDNAGTLSGTGTVLSEAAYGGKMVYICYKDINNHVIRAQVGPLTFGGGSGRSVVVVNMDRDANGMTEYGDTLKAFPTGVTTPHYQWQYFDTVTNTWKPLSDTSDSETYVIRRPGIEKYIRVQVTADGSVDLTGKNVVSDATDHKNGTSEEQTAYNAGKNNNAYIYAKKRVLTITFSAADKMYDGTAVAYGSTGTTALDFVDLEGVAAADVVKIDHGGAKGVYESKGSEAPEDKETGKPVTVNNNSNVAYTLADLTLSDGTIGDYYTLTVAPVTASITQLTLTWDDLEFHVGTVKRYDHTNEVYTVNNPSFIDENSSVGTVVSAVKIGETVGGVTPVAWATGTGLSDDSKAQITPALTFSFAYDSINASVYSGATKITVTAANAGGYSLLALAGNVDVTALNAPYDIVPATINPKAIDVRVGDLTPPSTIVGATADTALSGEVNTGNSLGRLVVDGDSPVAFNVDGTWGSTATAGAGSVFVQGSSITWTNKNYLLNWSGAAVMAGTITSGYISNVTFDTHKVTYGDAYSTAVDAVDATKGLHIEVYYNGETDPTKAIKFTSFDALAAQGIIAVIAERTDHYGTDQHSRITDARLADWLNDSNAQDTLTVKFYKLADSETADGVDLNTVYGKVETVNTGEDDTKGQVLGVGTILVDPKPVAPTAAWSVSTKDAKYYDGTTEAITSLWPKDTTSGTTGNGVISFDFGGAIINGDALTCTYTGAEFGTAGAGTDKTINMTGFSTGGAHAKRYTVTEPAVKGAIAPRPVDVTFDPLGDKDKDSGPNFDVAKNNVATGVGTEKLDATAIAVLGTSTVGTNKTVTLKNQAVTGQAGTDPANYAVTYHISNADVIGTRITHVGLTYNIPDTEHKPGDEGYKTPADYIYKNEVDTINATDVVWYEVTGLGDFATTNAVAGNFEAGKFYRVVTTVRTRDGYRFTNADSLFMVNSGSKKGENSTGAGFAETSIPTNMKVTVATDGSTATVEYIFAVGADTVIKHVNLTLTPPDSVTPRTAAANDAAVSSTYTKKGAAIAPATSMDLAGKPIVNWKADKDTDPDFETSVTGNNFESGIAYQAVISNVTVKSPDYTYDAAVDFTVNGSPVVLGNNTPVTTGLPSGIVSITATKVSDTNYTVTVIFEKQGVQKVEDVVILTSLYPEQNRTIPAVSVPEDKPYEGAGTLKWEKVNTKPDPANPTTWTWQDVTETTFQPGTEYRVVGKARLKTTAPIPVTYDITENTNFYLGNLGEVKIAQDAVEQPFIKDGETLAWATFNASNTPKADGSYDDITVYTLTLRFPPVVDTTDPVIVKVAANVDLPLNGTAIATAGLTPLLARNKDDVDMLPHVTMSAVTWTEGAAFGGPYGTAGTTFDGTKYYRATFTVEANAGYTLKNDTSDQVDFLVNSVTDTLGNWIDGEGNATKNQIKVTTTETTDGKKYTVTVDFPLTGSKADVLAIWGEAEQPVAPAVGTTAINTTNFAITKMAGQPYLNVVSIQWLNAAGTATAAGDVVRGETYTAELVVSIAPGYNTSYQFTNTATTATTGYINDATTGATQVAYLDALGNVTTVEHPAQVRLRRQITVPKEEIDVVVKSPTPTEGATVAPAVSAPGGAHYDVVGSWYLNADGTGTIDATHPFVNGTTYYLVATVTPHAGYTLPLNDATHNNLNRYTWEQGAKYAYSADQTATYATDGSYKVAFAYRIGGSGAVTVTKVPGNATAPVYDRDNPKNLDPNGWTSENFTVQGDVEWYEGTTATGTDMAGTAVKPNTVYTAKITVKPKADVDVPDGAGGLFNNNDVVATKNLDGTYTLVYTFPTTANPVLAPIVNIDAPAKDGVPDTTAVSPNNSVDFPLTGGVQNVTWYEGATATGTPFTGTFAPGKQYTVKIQVDPAGLDGISTFADGDPLSFNTETENFEQIGTDLYVIHTWPALAEDPTLAPVVNVTPAAKGGTPENALSPNNSVTVQSTAWTSGGTPVTGTFQPGKSYSVRINIATAKPDGTGNYLAGQTVNFNSGTKTIQNDGGQLYITETYNIPADPAGGGSPGGTVTVRVEPPVVYYLLRDMGVTNDLTAEKMAQEGDKPKAVPKVTPLDGLKFLGWSETEPKEGVTPTLVEPTTFSITQDKVFYAVYDKTAVEQPEEFDHNHYVIGFPDGTFGPEAFITRAQVATIVARACLIGFEDGGNYGNPGRYTDISDHWAYSAIAFCALHGVMSGYHEDDGTITFRPEQFISRQELANVVARLGGLKSNQGLPFIDVAGTYDWALDSIYTVYSNGWMRGYQEDDGTYTFRPANYITRAETVTVFNGFLHRGVDAEGLSKLRAYTHTGVASHNTGNGYDEYMIWPDVVGHWAYYEILEAGNDHNYHWQDETTQEPPEKWDQAYIDKKWRYTDDINDGAGNVGHAALQAVTYVVKFNGRIVDSVVRLVEQGTTPAASSVPNVVSNSGWQFVGWSSTDPDVSSVMLVQPTSVVINEPRYFYAVFEYVPEVTQQPAESAQPSESPAPAESAQPSESPAPTESAQPGESPAPAESAQPGTSQTPAESTQPGESPAPTESTQPSESPTPTESTQPSPTPAAPAQVNVTYVIKSEGKVVDSVTKQVDQGSAPAEDDVPSAQANDGWNFLGWSTTDPDEGNYQLVEPSSVTIEEDTIFYAVFEKVAEPQTEKNPRRAYISGFEDGTFRPDAPLNRSAAAKLLADLKGGYDPSRTYDTSAFTDLDDHWARNIIGYCVQEGLMSGYLEDDGTWTFRADNGITRQELACAMCKLTGETLRNQGLPFTDASDVAEWALDGVYTAYTKGWMTGYEDGLFHPEMIITRAAAVKLLNNYLGRQADPDTIRSSSGYTTWSDVPTSHWAYYEIIEASNDWDL